MIENSAVSHLLFQAKQVVEYHEKTLKVSGNGFSLIHALDLESDESRFHTRLLGYLLHPKAGHFQGDKFLNLFFKAIGINLDSTDDFTVEMEKYIGPVDLLNVTGGVIDILVSNRTKGIGFAIEVKIYAGEQPKQLERYANYLNSKFKNKESKVYYLTLEGNQSHVDRDFSGYETVSFKEVILEWLENCRIASIDQPIIRESLAQYIANIKRLTNQNFDSNMDKELTEIITLNDSNLSAYFSLIGTQTKIRRLMLERLATNLKKELEEEGEFEVSFPEDLGAKHTSIEFRLASNPSEKVLLYWLSEWGVVGIGLLNGKEESDEFRIKVYNLLSELRLGKFRGDFKNWVWLINIDSFSGRPNLTSMDWEEFNSKELVKQIANWVNQIADAYKAVKNEIQI